jgi:hypothetical protein
MARPPHRTGNLPAEATSFIGRRHERAELRTKLAAARLVSLVGPGGVGKTRLNQGQGGIYMDRRLKDRVDRSGVTLSFGLEDGLATAFDFGSPIDQTTEERAHVLADAGPGAEETRPACLFDSRRSSVTWVR